MKLSFLDRADEQRRLQRALGAADTALVVLYGRRRCGKSTLIQRSLKGTDVYFLADQREPTLQIQSLATELGRRFPAFDAARYDSWDALLKSLDERVTRPFHLFLDEFPYLAQLSPELPSVLQKHIDSPGRKPVTFIVSGSSQRMMQGLVLERSAPLYGRATEIMRIEPLRAGWLVDGLGLTPDEAVRAYAVWGGVPRYWELARPFESLSAAIRDLIMEKNGVLHEEPLRLLTDDMRSAVQPYSLLSIIGLGCHRLSEIGARLGKPVTSLVRPLAQLVELGFVRKDLPHGEDSKSSRRALYKLADPFLMFYFRFLQPNKSLLESGAVASVMKTVTSGLDQHVSVIWEQLARKSVPFLEIGGHTWGVASRWWGAGKHGAPMEVDVVAESLDGKAVLVGEAKWSGSANGSGAAARLESLAAQLPMIKGHKLVTAVWARHPQPVSVSPHKIITPKHVLTVLR